MKSYVYIACIVFCMLAIIVVVVVDNAIDGAAGNGTDFLLLLL